MSKKTKTITTGSGRGPVEADVTEFDQTWWIHFISQDGGIISMENSEFADLSLAWPIFEGIIADGVPEGTASISIELIDA